MILANDRKATGTTEMGKVELPLTYSEDSDLLKSLEKTPADFLGTLTQVMMNCLKAPEAHE